VHTSLSLDAWTQGTINEPGDAYTFAKGERISLPPYKDGIGARSAILRQPLDFAAVTDHAELLGEVELCTNPASDKYSSLECKAFRNFPTITYYRYNTNASRGNPNAICGDDRSICLEATRTPWQKVIQAAEEHYKPCQFTTFVGYEWTGAKYSGNNFHRNIIFHGSNIPKEPISFYEAPNKTKLWEQLNKNCDENCEFISIPHNSNLSNGQMFLREEALSNLDQQVFEPVIEIFQHKGSSECHPDSDTFCDFEQLPYKDFISKTYKNFSSLTDIPPASFARETLLEGLAIKEEENINPWKFGFIGSTDTHYAMPGFVDENNFQGHGGAGKSFKNSIPKGLPDDAEFNPGGLAVVWAKQNDRDHIFEALQNKEVYGTSGPKFILRFFGSKRFETNMCERQDVFNESYLMHCSTSPQYSIIASCDVAAAMMEQPGGTALAEESIMEALDFRRAMRKVDSDWGQDWWFKVWGPDDLTEEGIETRDSWMLKSEDNWHGFNKLSEGFNMLDPIKATIITPGLNMKGEFDDDIGIPASIVTKYLAEHGVIVEKTGLYSFFIMFTIGITKGRWNTLLAALQQFKDDYDKNQPIWRVLPEFTQKYPQYERKGLKDLCNEIHEVYRKYDVAKLTTDMYLSEIETAMKPTEAFAKMAHKEIERIAIDELEGRVTSVLLTPYPPGIPLLIPGEKFNKKIVNYLQFAEEFNELFPGFKTDNHGLVKESINGKTTYFVDCVKT